MTIVAAITTSFRKEMLQEEHHILDDTFKMALYGSDAVLGRGTTEYTTTGEISGTGYTAGGTTLSGMAISEEDDVALVNFTKPTWANATVSARAALIYNASNANKSFVVLDFGRVVSAAGETFELVLPPVLAAQALIRFA